MSVIIKKVTSKDDLMKFIHFGIDLYKGNDYFVPPLIYDERAVRTLHLIIAMPHIFSHIEMVKL